MDVIEVYHWGVKKAVYEVSGTVKIGRNLVT
jgi:hypothetical protein